MSCDKKCEKCDCPPGPDESIEAMLRALEKDLYDLAESDPPEYMREDWLVEAQRATHIRGQYVKQQRKQELHEADLAIANRHLKAKCDERQHRDWLTVAAVAPREIAEEVVAAGRELLKRGPEPLSQHRMQKALTAWDEAARAQNVAHVRAGQAALDAQEGPEWKPELEVKLPWPAYERAVALIDALNADAAPRVLHGALRAAVLAYAHTIDVAERAANKPPSEKP